MELTKEMYLLAKQVVDTYEKKDEIEKEKQKNFVRLQNLHERDNEKHGYIKAEMDKLFASNNYLNPFKEGIFMPCCGERYCFSYAAMKYMPKNNSFFGRKLEYRKKDSEGDIDYDPSSRLPGFVDYNGAREAIRQAKNKGLKHVHWRMSVATSEEIKKDGYIDHNDLLDTISW